MSCIPNKNQNNYHMSWNFSKTKDLSGSCVNLKLMKYSTIPVVGRLNKYTKVTSETT